MRTPSTKTLAAVFGDKAKEAKKILQASRAELATLPAGADLIGACYNPPKTYSMRLHCLNAIGDFYGIECVAFKNGDFADYINAGETYAPTIIYYGGAYRVQSVGDFVETQERAGRVAL